MAYRPCLTDGCTDLTHGTYCATHTQAKRKTSDARRGTRPWYAGAWQKLAKEAIQKQPWCTYCGATTDLTVDHVTPRSLVDGVQVLCRSCNSSKGRRV